LQDSDSLLGKCHLANLKEVKREKNTNTMLMKQQMVFFSPWSIACCLYLIIKDYYYLDHFLAYLINSYRLERKQGMNIWG